MRKRNISKCFYIHLRRFIIFEENISDSPSMDSDQKAFHLSSSVLPLGHDTLLKWGRHQWRNISKRLAVLHLFCCFIKTKNLLISIYCSFKFKLFVYAPDFYLFCRFVTIFFNSFQINEWPFMSLSKT